MARSKNAKCCCFDCGLEYVDDGWIEAIIPDKVWDAIRPEGCPPACGILCITCIARRIRKKGFETVPIWLCGTEHISAVPGDPDQCLPILRNWEARHAKNGKI